MPVIRTKAYTLCSSFGSIPITNLLYKKVHLVDQNNNPN